MCGACRGDPCAPTDCACDSGCQTSWTGNRCEIGALCLPGVNQCQNNSTCRQIQGTSDQYVWLAESRN